MAHHGLQVAVARGHDAHVHAGRAHLAQAQHRAFLEHAQKLRLKRQRQLADLVEKERPLVRQLEHPGLARPAGPGERALHVAEQLGFQQGLGNGRAADLDEGLVLARAVLVDDGRHHLLAHPGFAENEHRGIHLGQAQGLLVHVAHALGAHHDAPAVADARAQRIELHAVAVVQRAHLFQLFLEPLQLGDVAHVGHHAPQLSLFVQDRIARDHDGFAAFHLLDDGFAFERFQHEQGHGLVVESRVDQIAHAASHHLGGADARDALVGAVDLQRDALAVGDENAVEGRVDDGA